MRACEVKFRVYEVRIRAYEVKIPAYEVKISAYEVKCWAQNTANDLYVYFWGKVLYPDFRARIFTSIFR